MAQEFKIGRLRFNWAGVWQPNTAYNRDAVVQNEGKTYVCLIPHTSSSFYQDLNFVTPQGAFTPYWQIMLEGRSWKGSWLPNTLYSLGNLVIYGGTVYSCIETHTSGSQQIDLTKWEIYSVTDQWNLYWDVSTVYGPGDIVKYGGIVYRCTVGHASASTVALGLEADQAKWEIVHSGVEFKGAWATNVRYKLNDVVKFGPDLQICIEGHTSGNYTQSFSFDPSKWDTYLPGQAYEGGWSPSTVYQSGDIVKYGGYSYVSSTENNINNVPSVDSVNWTLLTTGYNMTGAWLNATPYKIGDVVSRNGSSFYAVADNVGQDPTSGSVPKFYVATGSSGTTVKIAGGGAGGSGTANLKPGMIVLGAGFNFGQRIVEVVDSATIILNRGPDGTVTDSQDLNFVGLNQSFWNFIVPGVKWLGRWSNNTNYYVGDIVVWKNTTYTCVQNHISTNQLRPDLDADASHWTYYIAHQRKNALAVNGDIEALGNDGLSVAIQIGEQSYVLRSTNNIPAWAYINVVPGVFYVASTGLDAPGYGLTWDKPWKSIKHACETVGQGTQNLKAGGIIKLNKNWLAEETYQYLVYQVNNGPLSGYTDVVADQNKIKRDTKLILDALIYDLQRGGNSQTVASTLSYFDLTSTDFVNADVAAKMPYFIDGLNYLFTIIPAVLVGQTPVQNYQALNGIPVGGRVLQIIDLANYTVDNLVDVNAILASLESILLDALNSQDKSSVPPANQGATATIFLKTGTYSEMLPITVPANVALVGDELRGSVVQPLNPYFGVAKSTSSVDNTITLLDTTGLSVGDKIQFESLQMFGGLVQGTTYYVAQIVNGTKIKISAFQSLLEFTLTTGSGTMNVYGGSTLSDMFYVRDGSGIRNMTLTGLSGTLTPANQFLTQRPSGGSYVSLDPGLGQDDTSAWIIRRSPYVQNVTNFGKGCVGLKIDGALHGGGNKSIVCNDFTQILSDGIGVWCTNNNALCEAVSVFSYYNYAGYLAENGGRIRATNGNSSYGTYGVIAEGFDDAEIPVTATVYNRSTQVQAEVQSSFGGQAQLLKMLFNNAGSQYVSQTTNLLNYSNNFIETSWQSDSNITLQQNFLAPTGVSEAWTVFGNTSVSESDYLYQNISINPAGAVYTNVTATNITGSGSGATFNITVTSTGYVVTVSNSGGSGYVIGNQLLVSGGQLGGVNNVNDCVITVTGLAGSAILNVTPTGTVPAGSNLNYTLSLYVKKGTANTVTLSGVYSGSSTVSSSITFNLNTEAFNTSSTFGGLNPVNYGKISLRNGWYRLWLTVNDTTGLNNQLQFRFYPRGNIGNAGEYSYIYGAQTELSRAGFAPSFYLETMNSRYSSYANYAIAGAGTGALAIGDEIRSSSIFQARVTDPGSGAGGSGYLTAQNNSQGGNDFYIILAQSDTALESNYVGMRLFINSGTGAGQYGYISSYNTSTKVVQVLKESFDNLRITGTSSATNEFILDSAFDTTQLYVDQPVQFIPTYYTTSVTSTSQASVLVTEAIGGTTNTLTVANTAQMTVNMPISFSGTTFSTITAGFVYYINEIIDSTTIKISSQLFGNVWPLTNAVGSMTLNYPSNTSYLNGSTANMSVNLPILFTGTPLGGISVGTTYYIQDVIDANNFTISNSLVTVTATQTNSSGNLITLDTSTALISLNPIVFSGTTFGGIVEGTKYYISKIVDANTITLSNSLIYTEATATQVTTNLVTVTSTTGFIPNNPIIFVGTTFGGIVAETVYYILAVNNSTTFTISQTPGGSAVNLTTASGRVSVKTSPAPISITSASGSMTGTSTAIKTSVTRGSGIMNGTFSTTLFGGVSGGTTYYINTIDSLNKKFSVTSAKGSGTPVTLTTKTGSMSIGEAGWDHINPGTPIATLLDSSTLYYIEPRTTVTDPSFEQTSASLGVVSLAPGTSYVAIAYGDNYWMALPSGNSTAAGSSDGRNWTAITLPVSATWTSIAYGNKYWLALTATGTVYYSVSRGQGWRSATLPAGTNWSKIAYGNGRFVAITSGSSACAYSTNFGRIWAPGSGLPNASWSGLTYGNGRFVAVASGGTVAAYSTDGITWVASTLPSSTTWSDVKYGQGRFIAVSSTSSRTAYSLDGINWSQSNLPITAVDLEYGQGVFLALPASGTTAYTSEDGIRWKVRTVTSGGYGAVAFGYTDSTYDGVFATLTGSNTGSYIVAGARAKGRAIITSSVIVSVALWESGSGYLSAPTVTFTDPNITSLAQVTPRITNGALGNPSFFNRGAGYNSNSTTIRVNGNGYADQYQTGLTLIVNNLTKLPQPGDNLTIAGNPTVYKVTSAEAVFGTVAPNIEANIQVSPDIVTAVSPENNQQIVIRQKYSQCRLTNHDFLNIGYGNFEQSNYPGVPTETLLSPQNQVVETNFGRVFYTSTDQDGNFKVGSLFAVEQATGIVTLSASQFGLTGLETLSLGGIAVGGSSVVIKQFSTDSSFVANSNEIVPTQKAIRAYLTSRLNQGGSNTFTGQLTAGTVQVGGPNKIQSTIPTGVLGSNIKMPAKVNFQGQFAAVDGGMAAYNYFVTSFVRPQT